MDAAWLWGQAGLEFKSGKTPVTLWALRVNYGTGAHGSDTNHEAVKHKGKALLTLLPQQN